MIDRYFSSLHTLLALKIERKRWEKLPKAGWREKFTGNDVISLWYLVPLKTQDCPVINARSMQFIS